MSKQEAVERITVANGRYLAGDITRAEWHDELDLVMTLEAAGWMTASETA